MVWGTGKNILASIIAVAALGISSMPAAAGKVRVKTHTKYYTITGKSGHEFARSMGRKGPYSFQHRSRAWATAARELTYDLVSKKTRYGCRVVDADVALKITYTMPRLKRTRGVPARALKRWRQMYRLLDRHEKQHGKYYRAYATKLHRAIKKLKNAKSCRKLRQRAAALAAKLGKRDSEINDRFDLRDKRSYRRMAMLSRKR